MAMLLLPQAANLSQPLAAAAAMTLLLLHLQPQVAGNNNLNKLPTYPRWFLEPLLPPRTPSQTSELQAKCFYYPTNAPFTTTSAASSSTDRLRNRRYASAPPKCSSRIRRMVLCRSISNNLCLLRILVQSCVHARITLITVAVNVNIAPPALTQ
uniref:Secreted protein n=1 Tax=Proboscia inermis TaxID=420281 RepID=A0A7S0BZ27_9STRA